jgi:hypothetical protein
MAHPFGEFTKRGVLAPNAFSKFGPTNCISFIKVDIFGPIFSMYSLYEYELVNTLHAKFEAHTAEL